MGPSHLCVAIHWFHHAIVILMQPFDHVPHRVFASNWITATTYVGYLAGLVTIQVALNKSSRGVCVRFLYSAFTRF